MAVDHFAVGDPMVEEGSPAVEIATSEFTHPLLEVDGQHCADVRLDGLERGFPLRPCSFGAAGLCDHRRPRGPRVERRHQPRDLADMVPDGPSLAYQCREPAIIGHAAHHDEVIADLAIGPGDVGDAEVHVGRDPPVQLYFPVTDPLARFPCREIDEVESHGLLELVHAVAEQHDERDVGLAKLGAGVDHAPTVPARVAQRHRPRPPEDRTSGPGGRSATRGPSRAPGQRSRDEGLQGVRNP